MENKTSKYFKYAIGEIILVVIGILIALQVNNWNEHRKSNLKERQYLESFKNDLIKNKAELKRVIAKSKYTSAIADSIIKLQAGLIQPKPIDTIVFWIADVTGFTIYQTQAGTVQDIIGSGNLDLIKNDSIRLAIGSWQANLKPIRAWEVLDKNSSQDCLDYLKAHTNTYNRLVDKPTLNESDKEIMFQDRLFLNIIENRHRYPNILNQLYTEELPKIERLLKQIDNEIKD